MIRAAMARVCPHCGADGNPLDPGGKCVRCRKRLPAYCFACYASVTDPDAKSCPECGRRRWVVGDMAQLACASEAGQTVRQHRFMTVVMKAGKPLNEWRCMKCLTDDTRTDAFAHFPDQVAAAP